MSQGACWEDLGERWLCSRQDGRCEVGLEKLKHYFAFQVFSLYSA